jgi:hypothetical protein
MTTYTDIARRVYNHTFKLDPIIRSLLDTDFYKLLMLQMIWGLYPKVEATFSLINRTTSVRLTEEIDIEELRAQLDHCRTLRFSKKDLLWQPPDFPAGLPALAGEFPAPRIPPRKARRAIRARISRALG